MRDGSDAIADWPILNALLNVAAGATWVSVHHGGGVGIGNSIHAGMVVLADGTDDAAERLERVLTPIRARASCGTPTPATTRRSSAAREHGLDLPTLGLVGAGLTAPRLLVRDLAQVVTPAGARGAAARRGARRRSTSSRTRYVLCDGGRDRSGRPDARSRPARRRRRRARRPRPLRDPGPRRLPHAPVLRRRPRRGVLPPRRAARPTRSSTRRAAGSSRPSARPRAPARTGSRDAVERHRGWMLRAGTTTFEGKSGYGLDRDTELASAPRRSRLPAASRRGSAPTPSRPSSTTRTPTSTSLLAEVLPEAAQLAEAADVFLERGAFDAAQARRYLEACRDAGPRAAAARRPVHRERARSRSRSSSARARSTTSRRRARTASRALAASDVDGRRCCPRARSSSTGRCLRRARSSTPGAAVALATDFNPGSAFCESLPLVCSLAAHPAAPEPGRGAAACTVNAAHVLGRADRIGPDRAGLRRRPRPPRRARLALPRLPPRRRPRRGGGHRRDGRLVARGIMTRGRPRSSAAASEKLKRHEYEVGLRRRGGQRGRARRGDEPSCRRSELAEGGEGREDSSRRRRAQARTIEPPSWRRSCKRGGLFAPLMLVTVMLLGKTMTLARQIVADSRAAGLLPAVQLLHGHDDVPRRTSGARPAGEGKQREPSPKLPR